MKRIFLNLVALISISILSAQPQPAKTLENSPNGNNLCLQWGSTPETLFTGTMNGNVFAYNVNTATNSLFKDLGSDRVYALAGGKNGTLLAASGEKGYTLTNNEEQTLEGHGYKVDDIAAPTMGNFIATASRDNSIIIRNADGLLQRQIKAHEQDVVSVAFSPDGELLASASKDNTVKVWEPWTGRLVKTFASANNLINDLVFSNDGTRLFAAGENGIIFCWSTKDWSKLFTLQGLPGALKQITISRDDQYLAAAGDARKIGVFDLKANTKELFESGVSTTAIQFSPDGKWLAALNVSGQILLWDVSAKNILAQKYPSSDKKAILELHDIRVTDKNNNGIIEPGDNADLVLVIKNRGNGRAYNARLKVMLTGNVQGIGVADSLMLGTIEAGEEITKKLPFTFSKDHSSGNVKVEVTLVAANGLEAVPGTVGFQTKGAGGLAYILVSDPVFYTPEGIVKKGLPVTMRYKLKNIGLEPATGASVEFSLPSGVVAANKLKATYPLVIAGGSVEDSLLFYADNSFNQGIIAVSMRLSGVTTGQQENSFSVGIGQDLRPKPDTTKPAPVPSAPATTQSGNTVGSADPGEGDFSVDTDIPALAKNENRIAIVIGNENYRDFNTRVEFASNDARIFKEYAQRLMGVETDNLFYLQDATSNDIRSTIEKVKKLMSLMNGRAEVVLYYSGATFVDDYFRDEYLVPVDLRINKLDDYFTLQNILSVLSDSKHQSITAFIDGTRLFESRLKPQNAGKAPRNFYLYGNTTLLKAASGNQSAAGSEKLKHGLFTFYLLKKFKLDKTATEIGKLAAYTEEKVKTACFRMGLQEQISELRVSTR